MLQGLTKLQSYVHKLKRDLHYNNYWVSLLIQDDEESKPYLISMTDSAPHLKDAMENGIYVDKKGESRTPSPSTKERIKSMFRLSLKK